MPTDCYVEVRVVRALNLLIVFIYLFSPPVKAKDAICNPVVMCVLLSVCL